MGDRLPLFRYSTRRELEDHLAIQDRRPRQEWLVSRDVRLDRIDGLELYITDKPTQSTVERILVGAPALRCGYFIIDKPIQLAGKHILVGAPALRRGFLINDKPTKSTRKHFLVGAPAHFVTNYSNIVAQFALSYAPLLDRPATKSHRYSNVPLLGHPATRSPRYSNAPLLDRPATKSHRSLAR